MTINKSLGNDGLSKEFCECFWDEIKSVFLASIHRAFLNQESSCSQKQAASKMLEKKTKTKYLLKTGSRYHDSHIYQNIRKFLFNKNKKCITFFNLFKSNGCILKIGL